MKITTEIMSRWFAEFNSAYFCNKLPTPRLTVSNSRTILGQFRCKRERHGLFRRITNSDFTIKISAYYDITEREYRNIMLHEMIHYHIAYHNLRDTSAHGVVFKKMMYELNSRHGWNITVSTQTRQWTVAERNRRKRYDVLTLETTDGRLFVSVINPAYMKRVDEMAAGSPMVRNHQWYVSSDEYFASFPLTRSLRGRRVKRSEFEDIMSRVIPSPAIRRQSTSSSSE